MSFAVYSYYTCAVDIYKLSIHELVFIFQLSWLVYNYTYLHTSQITLY